MSPIYILAARRELAARLAQELNIDKKGWRYPYNLHGFQGLVVLTAGWYEHPWAEHALQEFKGRVVHIDFDAVVGATTKP